MTIKPHSLFAAFALSVVFFGTGFLSVHAQTPGNGTVGVNGSCAGNESACQNGLICGNTNTCVAIPGNGTVGANGSCAGNENACQNGLTCSDNDICIADSNVNNSNTTVQCADGTSQDQSVGCANDGGVSSAATTGGNTAASGLLQNPLQAPDLATLLVEILGYVVKIGSIFLVLMLVFVGFQFVMAQGNAEKVTAARNALLWTAIGGLVLLGAQAIAIVIVSTVQSL